jgi:hypothetical protein
MKCKGYILDSNKASSSSDTLTSTYDPNDAASLAANWCLHWKTHAYTHTMHIDTKNVYNELNMKKIKDNKEVYGLTQSCSPLLTTS